MKKASLRLFRGVAGGPARPPTAVVRVRERPPNPRPGGLVIDLTPRPDGLNARDSALTKDAAQRRPFSQRRFQPRNQRR